MHNSNSAPVPKEALNGEASADSDLVTLKGTSNGFEILIETDATAAQIASELAAKLEQAPSFFAGGNVTVRFDTAPPRGYIGPIEAVTERFDLRIVAVLGPQAAAKEVLREVTETVEPVLAEGTEPVQREPDPVLVPAQSLDEPGTNGALPPKLLVGPVRSGSTLETRGHLVVLGDVNPGAEVRAVGSIVVLGRLRGIAHAGVEGGAACILALSLEPQQLRVGELVARAGDAEGKPEFPEIAYAKEGSIIVEKYQGRLPAGISTVAF